MADRACRLRHARDGRAADQRAGVGQRAHDRLARAPFGSRWCRARGSDRRLWLALRAAAGSPGRVNYSQVVAAYGAVRQFEIAAAGKASETLRWAKLAVGLALVLLGAAAIAWWWAPEKPADPPAMVTVTTSDGPKCGALLTGDNQQIRIQITGETNPTAIPFADVLDVEVVTSC